MDEAVKLTDAQYGSIFLNRDGVLKRVYSSDKKLQSIKPRSKGFTYQTYISGKPKIMSAKDLEKIHPISRELGIKSTIMIPLSYKKTTTGVLSIHRTNGKNFTEEEIHILELFGSFISLAIRKNELNLELAESIKAKDLFIAVAAHELRSPLTAISAYIHLLSERFSNNELMETQLIKQLFWESSRLNKLAKEFLEINRAKMGLLNSVLRENNFVSIINSAMQASSFSFPGRKILFENKTKSEKTLVLADFDRLIQVITNIIENAVKYSDEDKSINLSLEDDKKYYSLCIADQGRGIPEKDLRRISREFYKGRNSIEEGMGLGLYLTKLIVDGHKGLLKISSSTSMGTKIFVLIPKLENERSRNPKTIQ